MALLISIIVALVLLLAFVYYKMRSYRELSEVYFKEMGAIYNKYAELKKDTPQRGANGRFTKR